MKKFQLEGTPRTDLGKKGTKAVRNQDMIPAVIYGSEAVELPFTGKLEEGEQLIEREGRGLITRSFQVSEEGVRKLVYSPEIFEVELTIAGKKYQSVMRELQFHPVSDKLLHMDFLEVVPNKPVVMEVPVQLTGHAVGVRAGGKMSLSMRKIRVKGMIENIPEKIVIDVTNLELGKTIQIKDVQVENLTLMNASNAVVCTVLVTRAAQSAAAQQA